MAMQQKGEGHSVAPRNVDEIANIGKRGWQPKSRGEMNKEK